MKPRAFTLIEVVIAMVMGIIVMGTVVTVILVAVQDSKRARTIAAMQRDMAFVGQLLSSELRQAGLGVPLDQDTVNPPFGEHIVDAFGGAGQTTFYAKVLVAANSQVGIVGDLARDDANYPPFGSLHSAPLVTGDTRILWHNENNGACAKDSTVGTCRIGDTSLFFPRPATAGCTAFANRDCPWGVRRLLPNERIVISDGAGRWATARFGNSIQTVNTAPPSTAYTVDMADLSTGWGMAWPGLVAGVSAPVGTPTINIAGNPGEIPGGGYLSTPDRVFFRLTGTGGATSTCATGAPNYCNIERIRCFGDPDPIGNPEFPRATDNTINGDAGATRASFVVNTGTVKSNCGLLEVVARNVSNLSFTYFDAADAVVPFPINTAALKSSVRRVAYRIIFQKDVAGRPVTFVGSGSVRLQNL
ncbi:MAG: hypothetical protein HYS27_19965 [Deltaproteobacteria bacterium]|nr:hypothetical protein [Deltaproteobacteria bacterium]